MSPVDITLGAALALGLPVFPCRADKRPACPRGFLAATADPALIRELWRRHPAPLVGVPTGESSGLDALDIDAPRHPEAAAWFAARRDQLPMTRAHRTRSGGAHLMFRHHPGMRCWTGRPVAGVDGRAAGGYVIHWPAAGEPVICDAPLAPWPPWLLDELVLPAPVSRAPWRSDARFDHRSTSRYAAAAMRHAAQKVASAPIGVRNATLNAEAFSLARLIAAELLDAQATADVLAAAAIAAGLTPGEILATLRSAFAARRLL